MNPQVKEPPVKNSYKKNYCCPTKTILIIIKASCGAGSAPLRKERGWGEVIRANKVFNVISRTLMKKIQ